MNVIDIQGNGKALITADVHIDDYADYNYYIKGRLDQFDKLAERLVEMAKDNDCSEIWILGDLINRPNSRKYIENTAKRFLNTLTSNGYIVRFIFGQHDLSSKNQNQDYKDTLISLFDNDKLIYMDRQILKVNGYTYGFMNWRPEQSLDWMDESNVTELDVLFGHYTKSTLFGQDIDESKFKVMIHGDIHNDQVIGKFISVSNPIQHDMKSIPNGSCIVFDTMNCSWSRVPIDPDHTRFLRMKYTTDRALEGFVSELEYNVYKPVISVDSNGESKPIDWSTIDDLIQKTCETENLSDIHSEVESKCTELHETDFNFQLNWIYIDGYRSIVDTTINFDKGDRVALLGDNGSGKSSIIKAMLGVFSKNSYLKYDQSDFTDSMSIIVNLTYQNKNYEIQKGSKWRLVIDGEELSYSGITEFEKDLPVRLPFLNFLDLFFITSDVHNLSNQFNPIRRIELISKFYRLDKLKNYSVTAQSLYDNLANEIRELNNEKLKLTGSLELINTRISELSEFESYNRDELQSKISELCELRNKHSDYTLNKVKESNFIESISRLESEVSKISSELDVDINQLNIDLSDLNKQSKEITDLYDSIHKKAVEFENDIKRINQITEEGSKLGKEVESLNNNTCPECGSRLSNDSVKSLIETKTNRLEELRSEWTKLDERINACEKGYESKSYFVDTLLKLKNSNTELISRIQLLTNKISNYNNFKNRYDSVTKELTKTKEDYDQFKATTDLTEVKLPLEFETSYQQSITNLNRFDELVNNKSQRDSIETKVHALNIKFEEIHETAERYLKYRELMSTTGIIMEQILIQLANKFSSTEVKYEVESGVYRGSRYINFNSYFLSRGSYRLYETCSDGQKTICDLDFLNNLFSVNIGLLVMDEHLRHLDDKNFPKACEILSSMNVNTLVLSTHDNNLANYTKRILLSLDNIGRSVIEVI